MPPFRRLPLLMACGCSALVAVTVARAEPRLATVAGTGEPGYSGDGGAATEARVNNPFGVVVGPDGAVYFCDTGNHAIRRVDARTGIITTVAGRGGEAGYEGDGGPATEALMNEPYEIRFDAGGHLWVVEMRNHVVRRIEAGSGLIRTVAGTGEAGSGGDGGPARRAQLRRPHSIQLDREGHLYICDIGNHRIRRVDATTGVIDTFCGNGEKRGPGDGAPVSAETPLHGPRALDIDASGDLWLALREGNAVYRIDMRDRRLHHVAGTGEAGFHLEPRPAREALLSGPKGISVAPGGRIFLADTESHTVRVIDPSVPGGVLQLVAGTGEPGDGPDGPPLRARMNRLHGVFADPRGGRLYIGDSEAHRVRLLSGLPRSGD